MTHEPTIAQFARRIADGVATDDDHREARRLITESDDDLQFYLRYMRMHAVLSYCGGLAEQHLPQAVSVERAATDEPPVHRPRIGSHRYALAAALLLTGAIVVIVARWADRQSPGGDGQSSAPLASVIEVFDGTLLVDGQVASEGEDYNGELVTLDAGEAEFLLASRVSVQLRGKSELTIYGPMNAMLTHGTASFDCPPSAKGYTVHLPGGVKIVDLGTRFIVKLDDAGVAHARVLDGRIQVSIGDAAADDPLARLELATGQDAIVSLATDARPASISPNLVSNGGFILPENDGETANGPRIVLDPTHVPAWRSSYARGTLVSDPQPIFVFTDEYFQIQTDATIDLFQHVTVVRSGAATLSADAAIRSDTNATAGGHLMLDLYAGALTTFAGATRITPDATVAPPLSPSIQRYANTYRNLTPGEYTVRVGGTRTAGTLFQAGIDNVRLALDAEPSAPRPADADATP